MFGNQAISPLEPIADGKVGVYGFGHRKNINEAWDRYDGFMKKPMGDCCLQWSVNRLHLDLKNARSNIHRKDD